MKAQKISTKSAALFLFTTMALAGCGGAPQGNSMAPSSGGSQGAAINGDEELFSDASADAPNSPQDEATGEKNLRKRYVRVNFDLLKRSLQGALKPGSTFKLNLFDDKEVEITLEDVQKVSENNIVIVGRIKGDEDSAVTLVMKDGALVANVRRGDSDESFEVRAAGNGLHAIRVPAEEPKDDCQVAASPQAAPESTAADPLLSDKIGAGDEASPLANPVIDMLVAYTPRARSEQGGTNAIQALIQMGIADTNRALTDSGVNLQVRLVGMYETRVSETGNLFTDLSALQGKTDGKWDEIHTIRTRLGADQVTLVGSYSMNPNAAGLGNVYATYSSAFTIVRASYFRMYTMAHELGHNIGLNHSDGYENIAGRFRTIIAYGTMPRARRFSNPNLAYNGYRTGDAARNEAAILNRNGGRTAGLTPALVKTAVTAGIKSESGPNAAEASEQVQSGQE